MQRGFTANFLWVLRSVDESKREDGVEEFEKGRLGGEKGEWEGLKMGYWDEV